MTGNEQDSEDVVQETFLRAYKQLHRWEARSSFGTWLYRIAANYSLDLMRRRKRHGEVTMNDSGPDEDTPEMAQALPSNDPGPDRLLFSSRRAGARGGRARGTEPTGADGVRAAAFRRAVD